MCIKTTLTMVCVLNPPLHVDFNLQVREAKERQVGASKASKDKKKGKKSAGKSAPGAPESEASLYSYAESALAAGQMLGGQLVAQRAYVMFAVAALGIHFFGDLASA
jgi:hypothetical protein